MQAMVMTLLKSPATTNSMLLAIAVVLVWQHKDTIKLASLVDKLFTYHEEKEKRLGRLEGEHNAARALADCPMVGLEGALDKCPLLQPSENAEMEAPLAHGPTKAAAAA